MAARRQRRAPAPRFDHTLVLHQWMLGLFGVETLDDLADGLKDAEGLDENNVSNAHHVLAGRFPNLAELPVARLQEYDNNIVAHSLSINAKRSAAGAQVTWKYFQYLTLLFTEIYLDRYFTDPAQLRADLNEAIAAHNDARSDDGSVPLFDVSGDPRVQLNKLAYWNATGSGKTLIMHVNLLQYRHYLERTGLSSTLNRVILLTPNEGLSTQHLDEFALSGLSAARFDKDEATLLQGSTIDVLEITKLDETMGDKKVAVSAFEENNLVLVDEGHRGASGGSGGSWMDRRNALCRNGFSFEYSATFGQAVRNDQQLADTYSRSILFDYSYRWFYNDGFGKDYQILNLDQGTQADHQHEYLCACLLSFYQQIRLYELERPSFVAFEIDKPLWVFVGSSVNAVRTKDGKQVSDVIEVLQFIQRFVSSRAESEAVIASVLRDGLVGANGKNIFAGRFKYLKGQVLSPAATFNDVLARVFNAPTGGALHVENLRGVDGEIGLRVGENDHFGVINVGDDAKLVALCEQHEEFEVAQPQFNTSLFYELDDRNSRVNMLIGSRKFTEGWNSWRVSTMGLLNIGKSEGSQIIQLFGRGVRLRGWEGSLKRSSAIGPILQTPPHIGVLETLGVFGVHADYMATFRDFLADEGLPTGNVEEVLLPVRIDLGDRPLLTVGLRNEVDGQTTDFGLAFRNKAPVVTLLAPSDVTDERIQRKLVRCVGVNWYPKVQSQRSRGVDIANDRHEQHQATLTPAHLAILDERALHSDLQRFKNERGWHNVNITRSVVGQLLADSSWYVLDVPAEVMAFNRYDNVRQWQQIAEALLRGYLDRFYKLSKQAFELPLVQYRTLTLDDKNLLGASSQVADGYHYRVTSEGSQTLAQLRALKQKIEDGTKTVLDEWSFPGVKILGIDRHAYEPLLAADGAIAMIQPAPLDKNEARFVRDIRSLVASGDPLLDGWELRFMRNRSRGSGMGFFEGGNFYPDFVIWLSKDDVQHLVFVDPKGMRNLGGTHHPKVEFHNEIKIIEARLAPDEPNVHLHSWLVSVTPKAELTAFWNSTQEELHALGIVFQDDPEHLRHIVRSVL